VADPEPSRAGDRPETDGTVALAEGEAEAADRPARPPSVPGPGRFGRFGQLPGLLRDPRVAWAVALVALVSALVLGLQARSLQGLEDRRAAVREAAEIVAARLTTFEGASIDEWVAQVQQLATSEYAGQLVERFDQALRESLRANDVRSTGEILDSYIQRLDGDDALAFILVRQTSTNAQRPQPIEDELRMEVTLRDVGGEWLAADVAVLGPSFLAGGDAGGTPAPTEAPSTGPPPAGPTLPAPTTPPSG